MAYSEVKCGFENHLLSAWIARQVESLPAENTFFFYYVNGSNPITAFISFSPLFCCSVDVDSYLSITCIVGFCYSVRYFVSILALQSSRWGRERERARERES